MNLRFWLSSFSLFLTTALLTTAAFAANPIDPKDPKVTCERLLVAADPAGKAEFLNDVATVIDSNREEIKKILLQVDSEKGAAYEIHQAIQALRGAPLFEMKALKRTRTLKNVAVYGSTNIPLYTLVLHAFIPATISENVWFRAPLVSRQVYAALFEFIQSKLPNPARLDGVHVLTEPKEVQYDNFRKAYVLGLHQKGKRFLRAPSEVVIFTGNPETGRQIFETNSKKLKDLAASAAGHEQIFLMFGTGLNPVVITKESGEIIDEIVDALIEPTRINSSQDCIAPSFCMISTAVRPQLMNRLLPAFAQLKLGSDRFDKSADYLPLVFTDSVQPLIDYRAKYEQFLLTPDAKINAETKAVEPHVFLFPIEMWGKVEIVQHYAPFLVFFEYSNPAYLKVVATEDFVRKKAMFASIYGERDGEETNIAIRAFQNSQHEVKLNKDVFADENGNLPFGGNGPDASTVFHMRVTDKGEIEFTAEPRPILFSSEAAGYFPKK